MAEGPRSAAATSSSTACCSPKPTSGSSKGPATRISTRLLAGNEKPVSLVMLISPCRAVSRRRGTASSRLASWLGIQRPLAGRDICGAKIAARMQGRIVRRTMLQQEAMIERTRSVCREDERLAAAMMYGSFAQGEGDGFSDIEFILFFRDEELEGLDQEEWVSRISPVGLYFVNEYGNGTAIFENLVRGEFHFDRASDIERVVGESMRDADWLPSLEDTLILDRTGELAPRLRGIVGPPPERDTPGQIRFVCDCFVNWFVFGANLFARGEMARSLDLLGIVRDRLLQMVRVLEG